MIFQSALFLTVCNIIGIFKSFQKIVRNSDICSTLQNVRHRATIMNDIALLPLKYTKIDINNISIKNLTITYILLKKPRVCLC